MTREDAERNFEFQIAGIIFLAMSDTNMTFQDIDRKLGWNLGATRAKVKSLTFYADVGDNTRKAEKNSKEFITLKEVALILHTMGLKPDFRLSQILEPKVEENGSGI